MLPKTRLILLGLILFLTVVGVLVALLVTVTPRSVEYTLSTLGEPSCTTMNLLEDYCVNEPEVLPLSTVLYKMNLIRVPEDIDDSDLDIPMYHLLHGHADATCDIPMTMLYQIYPRQIASTRDFLRFQGSGNEERQLYFAESKEACTEYTVSAFNYNLRTRQTAIFLFFMDCGELSGVVLNNVWLYPRTYTFINALVSPKGTPFAITDLDNNATLLYEGGSWDRA